jgi:hypothetical protein
LYPSHHGLVDNFFYDYSRKEFYAMSKKENAEDGSWYGGVPLWSLAAKLSLDTEITSFLKVGLSTLNTYIINKGQDTNPMEMALRASPFTTPYKEDGSLRTYLPGSGQNVWNPLLDTQNTFKLANVEKKRILTIKPLKYEKFKFQKRFNWSTGRVASFCL